MECVCVCVWEMRENFLFHDCSLFIFNCCCLLLLLLLLLLFCYCFSAAAAAKSLQLCPTLCDPIDGSPPGSPVPGILQARTVEWVAISFSSAWKWKVKVKSRSRVRLFGPHGLQPTRLLHPWNFPGKSTGVGCQFRSIFSQSWCTIFAPL